MSDFDWTPVMSDAPLHLNNLRSFAGVFHTTSATLAPALPRVFLIGIK